MPRCLALVGLLVLEVTALTLSFEGAHTLGSSSNEWARLLSHAHLIVPIGACSLTAVFLFFGFRFRGRWHVAAERLHSGSSGWPYLPAHFTALALFVLQTAVLFQSHDPSGATGFGILSWALAGLTTGAFWLLCIIPRREIIPAAKASAPLAAVGTVGIAAWSIAQLGIQAWEPLSRWTFLGVQWTLSGIYPDVICLPESLTIGTPALTVHIAPACSGYQGVGLVLAFMTFYLWCFRRTLRFPRALALLPLAAGITWLANILRIAALIVVGNELGPDVAVGGFDSNAGWILFCAISLGIGAAAHHWRFIQRNPAPRSRARSDAEILTCAYLLPMVTLAAATLIMGAFSSEEARLVPLCVIPVALTLFSFRSHYPGSWGQVSWSSVGMGCLVFALWVGLDPTKAVAAERQALFESIAQLPASCVSLWLAGRIVLMVLLAPIIEELAFRGYLTRRLIAADFTRVAPGTMTWVSVLVSSVAFGLLHDRWVAASVAGVLYAFCYRRGRIAECVHAHVITNGLLLVYLLAGDSGAL